MRSELSLLTKVYKLLKSTDSFAKVPFFYQYSTSPERSGIVCHRFQIPRTALHTTPEFLFSPENILFGSLKKRSGCCSQNLRYQSQTDDPLNADLAMLSKFLEVFTPLHSENRERYFVFVRRQRIFMPSVSREFDVAEPEDQR